MITVPTTGAMITPMSVKAMAMPRFGDRIPSLAITNVTGIRLIAVVITKAARSVNVANTIG